MAAPCSAPCKPIAEPVLDVGQECPDSCEPSGLSDKLNPNVGGAITGLQSNSKPTLDQERQPRAPTDERLIALNRPGFVGGHLI